MCVLYLLVGRVKVTFPSRLLEWQSLIKHSASLPRAHTSFCDPACTRLINPGGEIVFLAGKTTRMRLKQLSPQALRSDRYVNPDSIKIIGDKGFEFCITPIQYNRIPIIFISTKYCFVVMFKYQIEECHIEIEKQLNKEEKKLGGTTVGRPPPPPNRNS